MWKPNKTECKIGAHSMTVVGYNNEGFILRNSWGNGWGDDGHTIFPYKDFGRHHVIFVIFSDRFFLSTGKSSSKKSKHKRKSGNKLKKSKCLMC